MIDPLVLQGIGERLPLGELWGTDIGFIILFTVAVAAIGLAGRNLAISAMGAYLTFTFFAINAGIEFLELVLYVTLTLVFIGTLMKIWRLEGFETGS